MIYFKKSIIPIQQGQSGAFFVNLPSQSKPTGPTTGNDEEPFDLTGATEIIATFPGGVSEKLSLGQVSVAGASGGGKIQVAYSAQDSNAMQANPVASQNQDLQVVVVKQGTAQVDTLSISSVTVGTVYSVSLNGQTFTYTAQTSDNQQSVFTALAGLINSAVAAQSPGPTNLVLTAAVVGSGTGATMTITSTFAGLSFTDVVSTSITLANTTANGGTISVFLFKFALDISPQSYPVT